MTHRSGETRQKLPYMGNIQIEVFPINLKSFFRREFSEVNTISIHHPKIPQFKNFNIIFFIIHRITGILFFIHFNCNVIYCVSAICRGDDGT